jgi:hypothetical protein
MADSDVFNGWTIENARNDGDKFTRDVKTVMAVCQYHFAFGVQNLGVSIVIRR